MRGKMAGVPMSALLIVLVGVLVSVDVEAAPIQIPDLSKCALAVDVSVVPPTETLHLNCCLPSVPIIDFSFENYKVTQKHIRRPAQRASEKYIKKFNKAYTLMRALPDTDPRGFKTQADIHCAFCNGAYTQLANSTIPLQVHFSWLFLTWHRWYLYFHERILASLVHDPGFSLVYWNWDDQVNGGNVLPDMFARNGTALYDAKRNPAHLPPALVHLSVQSTATNNTVIINENLNAMYQSVVTATTADLFMGGAYRIGTDLTNSTVITAPLAGSLEGGVHNAIHFWTGDPRQPLLQDMGTFTTAARDPVFYGHHSNVDRLWDVWRFSLPGGERFDHTDPDFLDAEFLFYDENANLVKVKAGDALNSTKLGVYYKKSKSDALWINYQPPATTIGSAVPAAAASGVPVIAASPANGTIDLGAGLTGIVAAPTGKKPSKTTEVLTIQGVEVTRDNFVSLVVFVNLPLANASTSTDSAEYVGTFNIVPSASAHRHLLTNAKFEIGDNLKRIGIAAEKEVVITIVKEGNETVTIQGMEIKYE